MAARFDAEPRGIVSEKTTMYEQEERGGGPKMRIRKKGKKQQLY